ncbi:centromere-associated protein E isoform X5 [Xyrichtys novacula]|uniref:Centromere-associated protein E n=1 Tax=Xyrichtys novacula TaxID=13765 RepID=A0AAV1GUN5_XYRNO|nr:centromere-associated protein E isoform X5 [Xyrichtys novacula]
MTEESAVAVCVRVRPLIEREESGALENAEPVQLFWKADKKSIHQIDDGNSTKSFSFDRVFTADETTNQLYQTIAKPLVVSTVEGYNGTIFAYGQTSSGKTFTMMGSKGTPGVIPLAVEDVFQTIKNFPKKEFLLRVSYMEIYNETVTDLLVDSWKRKPLEIRETINKNIYVADLTEELVTTPAQALAWIRKGEKNRHYGKTKMNQRSSRSHTMFRMILESRERSDPASGENADGAIIVSHLNLVDLAGSERASQTGAEGARLKEGCNINRSLFILGQVIKKVTDENQKGFTNYRDSKLTRILQNSLGGNAKTVIICTITPVALEETLSTLQFASTAKKMKNDPHVTEVSDDGALLKRYRNEIVDLKRRLQEVSSVTQTTATEKEVLSQLLQEKDQLQREQEDRIKNLTKLLVTSSNQFQSVPKMPKRRVTWGGKMLRLAHPSAFEGGISELSYAEPVGRKRKADRSCLSELCEDDEDFQWEISDEPQEDMEMSQNYVTTRSFEDSPKDPWSQDWMRDIQQKDDALTKVEALDSRVQELEQQLQTESQHKQEALEKVETFDSRVMELEQQLQVENQQKQEALEKVEMLELRVLELEPQLQTESQQKQEKMEMFDIRVLELEQQLQTESQHKQEALEKMEMFDSRVLELEKQLQAENQQKQEALEKMETFNSRVLELEQQLQAENQQKPESLEKMEMFDSKVLELEQQLQMENQQKQESLEKMEMLELRVLDLERQLEEQSHSQSSSDEQMRREFAETIQLCEQMASEKDVVAAERNYLKDELGMFIEQTESLEKENAALLKELEERREVNEFETLEEELRNEQENKLHEEISCLKKANSDSELHCLELQKKLESLSEELKRKSDFAEELQNMNGKDLVQEVTKLRRSLDDAEGVSRDTKKEWAHLRSQNIALEEANVSLSTSHEKMKAEAESMRSQLEAEKSSFRKIQSDLEKELNVAFDENTKLTALLDGKVPKNLMDSVELERTVSNLNKELTTSRAAEETLRAQLEELASSQAQLENLMQQVRELTEELCATQTQRDGLISAQTQSQEEAQQLRDSLQASQEEILSAREEVSAATLREEQLREQLESVQSSLENSEAEKNLLNTAVEEKHSTIQSLSAELQCVREEKETLQTIAQSSAEETEKLQSAVSSLTEERDQLKTDMQESVEMMIENQEELRSALEKTKEQKKLIEQLQTAQTSKQDTLQSETSEQLEKLQTQIQSLTEQLQSVLSERDCLLSERTASSHSEEMEKLQHRVTSLSTDRDQLQETLEALREQKQQITQEMQDRVDTLQAEYAETQILLQTLENKLEEKNSDQKTLLEQKESGLMEQIQSLSAELQCVREEKETLRTLAQSSAEETEKLQSAVSSLTEERDQLKTDMQESVEMMIENQEELRAALEKNTEQKKLIEELQTTQTSKQDTLQPETSEQLEKLQTQIQSLTEQLQSILSERDFLLSERTANSQIHSEEMEKLQHRVTSLSTDRDQLQETLEALREQKQQITQEMQDRVDTLQAEMNQLQGTLQAVSQQKNQLEDDLQQNMETATQTQSRLNSLQEQLQEQTERNMEVERLSQERQTQVTEAECRLQSVQEELQQLKQKQANQMKLSEQKESDLEQQIKGLSEQLVGVQAERDDLLLEKEASCQRVSEEMRRRVTSLSTDRDQLQETLNALREQKQQITQEMQDRVDTLQAEITSLREQLSKQKVEEAEREAELQEKVQQLKEELQVTREKQTIPETEADTSQQLLSEANKSTYALQEQLSSKVRESAMSRLQESTDQLQEALKKFEDFHKFCFKYNSKALKKIQRDMPSLTHLPNTTLNLFNAVDEMGQQGFRTLGEFMDNLQARAQGYKTVFEDLVQKDLDVYEERRLQDVLQCKAQATSCSLKDEDFNMLWEQRLSRLLEKRTLCLQDMESVLGKLWKIIEPFCQELQIEMKSMERLAGNFKNIMKQPVSYGNNFLSQEQDLRSAEAHNRAKTFQSITDEHNRQAESLKLLQSQTDNELREERSRRSTLLQALEGAPLKTEPSLLKDNQRLLLKLQQTEERIRALCEEREQLEEAQITTNSRLSNHKQATQLLQTELQDSQAQVEEKESIIQTLRSKLRQSEENAPPSVAELEKLKNKLFKVETDLSSASEKHQIEIKRMTALLNGKEESLRKLKETLRKSQQQGEESFLQGEDLHARLTNPKGSLITSSVLQEKAKLEEEVKQLHLKIAELESLVSSQLVEINKWKSRAVKLKAKNKSDTDKSPPRTPAKRDLPDTSDSSIIHSPLKKFVAAPREVLDSPRKILSVKNLPDSPKVPWLNSPKSRFFDIEGSSDLISRNCPKQFFDNSGLGTVPGKF